MGQGSPSAFVKITSDTNTRILVDRALKRANVFLVGVGLNVGSHGGEAVWDWHRVLGKRRRRNPVGGVTRSSFIV